MDEECLQGEDGEKEGDEWLAVPLKDSLYNNERVDKGWNILTEEYVAFEQAQAQADVANLTPIRPRGDLWA